MMAVLGAGQGWLRGQQVDSGVGTAASRSAAARPNPDAGGRYHVGDGVSAPTVVYQVDPQFTDLARKAKVRGNCVLALVVGEDGRPREVRVKRSIAEGLPAKQRTAALSLDEKAVEAVRAYRLTPAMFQGKAVPVELSIEVNFQIF